MQQQLTSRLTELFLELCAIPSPPGDERAVADRVTRELDAIGLAWEEDDGGPGDRLQRRERRLSAPGALRAEACRSSSAPTSTPCRSRASSSRSSARTASSATPAARSSARTTSRRVAVMIEAARRIVDERRPHAGVELLFTPMEEIGLVGATAFDIDGLEARVGYVYDQAAPDRRGDPRRAERAGARPPLPRAARARGDVSRGRAGRRSSPLSRAIVDMPLGRIDELTSANVGLVRGGTARNVVPEWCELEAEVRSHDFERVGEVVQQLVDAASFAAAVSDCTLETRIEPKYRGYRHRSDDVAVRIACDALERSGFEPRLALSGGAADANVFTTRGCRASTSRTG